MGHSRKKARAIGPGRSGRSPDLHPVIHKDGQRQRQNLRHAELHHEIQIQAQHAQIQLGANRSALE